MSKIRPLRKRVLAELKGLGGKTTAGGIFIPDENRKEAGIRPRWALVRFVGEGIDWIKPGQYALVSHGRWSRQFECEHDGEIMKLVMLDNDEILAVQDTEPSEF